jgi:quercetin dioxygenase-like cupin family protein
MGEMSHAVRWADVTPVEMLPGVVRRTLGCTDRVMLIEWRFKAGAVVPLHQHPHDQVGYMIHGEMELEIDGQPATFCDGDSWAIPGNVPHWAHFPSDCVLIECFTPPREDYR